MERIINFGKDLVGDGYKIIGIAAPILSIVFLLAKALEWPVKETLQNLSYAWALLPITVWFFIAYVRRWQHSKSLEGNRDLQGAVDTLSDFLDDGNTRLFNAHISNDSQHVQWCSDWGTWTHEVEDHLEQFFSRAERNGFRNLVLVAYRKLLGSYNDVHNAQRCQLEFQLRKIRGIMTRYSTVGRSINGTR